MFPKNLIYSPETFAGRILIDPVNLSKKTKDFLKGKSIYTILSFINFGLSAADDAPNMNIKREIEDFHVCVLLWLARTQKGIRFSKNIPPPKKYVYIRAKEKVTLIAILLGEPLFGTRRNIALAKRLHLPRLYATEPEHRKKQYPFPLKTIWRHQIAS